MGLMRLSQPLCTLPLLGWPSSPSFEPQEVAVQKKAGVGELWVTGAQSPRIEHFLSHQASGGSGKRFA